uniref:NADH-ubiquinone oxidoreductase chain 4 n=1 Tax=Hiatella sp. J YW-2023 TaxID=3074278 RepID=A0AA51YKR3_9BIVA|nr:NADH dehydrogenase subunit 4 [Hiatella sp. J YW-2023]
MESFVMFPSMMVLCAVFLGLLNVESLLFSLSYSLIFLGGTMGASLEALELGSFFFMFDSISFVMIVMSLLVVLSSVWASEAEFKVGGDWANMMMCFQITSVICLVGFSCVGLFSFFMVYEMSVIPMMGLILFWGAQPERITAVLVMVIYTLLGSIPLFIGILEWWFYSGTDSMVICQLLASSDMGGSWGIEAIILGISSFLVKLPMYGVHSWLPKAHVEAPVSGSMILAGIMLKLGGYGLIRFLWCFSIHPNYLTNFIMVVSVVGGFMASLACLVQSDLKRLIAFSSVSHMSMVLGGVLSMSEVGMKGGVLMMFSHGFSSPCLFYLMNEVSINRKSRSLVVCKGFMVVDPSISLVWFLMSSLNLGCPPSMSYFSEIFIIGSVMDYSYFMGFLILVSFLAGIFSMVLFCFINHGPKSWKMDFKSTSSSRPLVVSFFCSMLSFMWFFFVLSIL